MLHHVIAVTVINGATVIAAATTIATTTLLTTPSCSICTSNYTSIFHGYSLRWSFNMRQASGSLCEVSSIN